jgi:methyl-accepting chemotaxis protein
LGVQYMLAAILGDGSCLVFSTPTRMWGLSDAARWAIRAVFLALSITLFTAIAARQFARPIKSLAAAVRDFGMNPQTPPIPESGPRELRQVIRTFNEMQAMVDGALAFFRDDAVAEPTTDFDLPQVLLTVTNDYADQQIEISYSGPAHMLYQGRPFAGSSAQAGSARRPRTNATAGKHSSIAVTASQVFQRTSETRAPRSLTGSRKVSVTGDCIRRSAAQSSTRLPEAAARVSHPSTRQLGWYACLRIN